MPLKNLPYNLKHMILSQSVVAGVSEADTITLHVEGGSKLSIYKKKIGRKKEAIVVSGKFTCLFNNAKLLR